MKPYRPMRKPDIRSDTQVVRDAQRMTDITRRRLQRYADDPMWDSFAEVPKILLLEAIAEIDRLRAALEQIANPDALAADAMNFGRFPEAYQKYVLNVARDALNGNSR